MVSTGPYMFETNDLGKSFTLVRNPNWDPATDPNRKALPDKIEVAAQRQRRRHRQPADLRRPRRRRRGHRRAAGGAGPDPRRPDAQGERRQSAVVARLWYTSINGDVAPLDNIHCRKAVEYAADQTGYQSAYGGPTGGDIATNLMPPVIPGAQQFDLYPSASTTTATWPRPRTSCSSAASRTASPPASPTGPSGPRRRRSPRRCSSRWRRSGSSSPSSPTRWPTTSRSTPASRTSPRRTTSA